eukprot:668276-Pleurochrysis_carterae.AAC.5
MSLLLRTPNRRLAKLTMQRRGKIPRFYHELSKSTNCNSAKVWCSLVMRCGAFSVARRAHRSLSNGVRHRKSQQLPATC